MRTKSNVNIETMYKAYIKQVGPIDRKTFKLILYTLNKLISKHILNGNTVKLGYRLGTISIGKRKMMFERMKFDYAEYNKTGTKSFFLNGHSDEYYASAYWKKKQCLAKNKTVYRFDLTRHNNRELAKIMKEKNGHHRFEVR